MIAMLTLTEFATDFGLKEPTVASLEAHDGR